jgi:hypothetical protein
MVPIDQSNSVLGTGVASLPSVNTAASTGTSTALAPINSYFQTNPDVAAAYQANNMGMTADQFAQTHYDTYGKNEQRAAPTTLSTAPATTPVFDNPLNHLATVDNLQLAAGLSGSPQAPVQKFDTTVAPPNYDQLVRDQFASIGRTGIGTGANQIDQEGYDYWVNALKNGTAKPEDLGKTFQSSVADYMIQKPTDQYSNYVADYLNTNKPAATQAITDLYKDAYGHVPTAAELGQAFKQYGSDFTPEELTQFRTGAAKDIGSHFADPANSTDPNAGLLAGFKYVHDQGISDDSLKKTFGDTTYNQYKQKFNDFAKTSADNIMADKNLSFDEAAAAVKFANDYGLSTQDLAKMTGYNKSLFENIKSGYDKGVATIASKLDTNPDTATPAELKTDIGSLLAAQQKYGITDAQLASASNGKYTETGIAQLLDPIRNIQKTVTDLGSNATTSGADVRKKLQDLQGNKYVSALYGDALGSLTTAAGKTYSGNYGGKNSTDMNPLAVSNVLKQLTAERDAAKQSGTNLINGGATRWGDKGWGSEDAVLEDMAKNLVASGVTDIRQVAQAPVRTDQKVTEQYTYNGQPVQEVANDYGGGISYFAVDKYGESIPVDKSQLVKSKGYTVTVGGGEDYNTVFVPLTPEQEKSIKDGKVSIPTGDTRIINKDTGAALLTNYSERTTGDKWSGTFAGDGNTGYGVKFNADGVPIFYTQGASSSDLGKIAPLLAVASFIPGVAPFAMAANAAIAASQGNWLGALASGIGALPGLDAATGVVGMGADTAATLGNVSKGLGVANAINQGNWAGVLAGAANLGGVGNTQIGDTGFTVGQGLKSLGVLGALNRGDYLGAGLGGASLAGVETIPGTGISLNNATNGLNIARAVQSLGKTGNSVPLINAVGNTITRAKGGLLDGLTPDKVRANARYANPAMFQGIAANLRAA